MPPQDERSRDASSSKKSYEQPELTVWGSVTELTGTGCTNQGNDFMSGSVENGVATPPGEPSC